MIKVALWGGPFDGVEMVTGHDVAPPQLRFNIPVMPELSWWDITGDIPVSTMIKEIEYQLLDPWAITGEGAYLYRCVTS